MSPPLQLKIVILVLGKLDDNLTIEPIAAVISDYLVADLSLSKAIELSSSGSVALLDLVWTRSLEPIESSRWSVARLLQTKDYYYKSEFSKALVQTLRRGDLMMIQWLLRHFSGCPVKKEVVEEAAKLGQLWALQLLEDDDSHGGITWSHKILDLAAEKGHWDMVRWLHKKLGTSESDYDARDEAFVADFALKQNNVEQLKWAFAQGFNVRDECFYGNDIPGEVGQWEAVRFVLEWNEDIFVLVACIGRRAVQLGDMKFLRWLVVNYMSDGSAEWSILRVLDSTIIYGNMAMFQYMFHHAENVGVLYDLVILMETAAAEWNVDVVKWLLERYSSAKFYSEYSQEGDHHENQTVMESAASHGHLEVLKLLHQADRLEYSKVDQDKCRLLTYAEIWQSCTTNAMNLAASHGHLEVVKWLHDYRNEGCTVFAMNHAAANGHLDVVQWLHEHRQEGCTKLAMNKAAANGHLDVVQWLHEHRQEGCTKFAMNKAAVNGHLDVVQWLHENRSEGCTSDAIDEAAIRYAQVSSCDDPNYFMNNQLAIIQWLHGNRSEGCTAKAMDGAAAAGNFEMVKWLHENTTAKCTERVMDEAAGYGRMDIVKWLHEKRTEGCSAAAMEKAAAGGFIEVLQWLHSNCSMSYTDKSLEAAAKHGHFKVVRWLFDHGEKFGVLVALESALSRNHLEMACYLYDKYPENSVRYGGRFDRLRDISSIESS